MAQVKLTLGLVLIILVVIFTAQNAEVVTVRLFFWSFSISRALMIFFVLAIGLIVGWSAAAYHFSRKRSH